MPRSGIGFWPGVRLPRKRTPGLQAWEQRAATAAPESRCGAAVAARECHTFNPGVLRKRAPPAKVRCGFAALAAASRPTPCIHQAPLCRPALVWQPDGQLPTLGNITTERHKKHAL